MSKAARSGFKDRSLPFQLSSRSGRAAPVSFRFLDPRSAVVSLTVNVMDCRFRQIPIWLLTSWNLPHKMPCIQAQSSRGSQAPTPVTDTLFSGEGYDDTLNVREGMRGTTATGHIIWQRNFFAGRLPTADFLALACCHANETKINIPRSAKPCVNNCSPNNLNKAPHPRTQITATVFVRRQCKINRKREERRQFHRSSLSKTFPGLQCGDNLSVIMTKPSRCLATHN